MSIEPASNNQFKDWKKLLMGKYRKKNVLFLAEGERCVEQILRNGLITAEELIVREGDVPAFVRRVNIPVYSLDSNSFNDLADTETPQGVIAVCHQPNESSIDNIGRNNGVIVAFDAIQDPGNLGTMIRTASWFGASGMISGNGTVDFFHPKVVRSTAGATGSIPYVKGNLQNMFKILEQSGWTVYLLDGSAKATNLNSVTVTEKSVLVVGNEGNGIHSSLFASDRQVVKISGTDEYVESLNAAVALSIGLYHFCK